MFDLTLIHSTAVVFTVYWSPGVMTIVTGVMAFLFVKTVIELIP